MQSLESFSIIRVSGVINFIKTFRMIDVYLSKKFSFWKKGNAIIQQNHATLHTYIMFVSYTKLY